MSDNLFSDFFDLELEECNEFDDVIIGDVMTG
jgi:hypothetical protein